MSVNLPKAGSPAPRPAQPDVGEDWRTALTEMASQAGSRVSTRQRTKNPLVPDNFLDFTDSGFPADLVVLPIQIPRQGMPAEMAQYRDMLNRQWLHVPWNVVSTNAGADGKAVVAGAQQADLGGGHLVVTVAGHYLMFADKQQYRDRRARNTAKTSEAVSHKMESRVEADGKRRNTTNTGPMTVEELFEYEKSIGDEPSLQGVRID